jgi:nitrite reductase (NADH) small subunit
MWCLTIDNYDPIGGANVLSRGIVGDINGELVVASPLYKQHFSLLSGRCLEDDSVQVSVYQARLEGDAVIVMLQTIVQDRA